MSLSLFYFSQVWIPEGSKIMLDVVGLHYNRSSAFSTSFFRFDLRSDATSVSL